MSIFNVIRQKSGVYTGTTAPEHSTDFTDAIIICDGNSITYGVGYGAGFTYPQVLAFSDPWNGNGSTFYNFGVNSQTTAMMIADAATQIDVLYNPDVVNVVIAWEIGNDIGTNIASPTIVADCFARFKSYCLARKAVGFKVIAVNCPHRALTLYSSNTIETEHIYNGLLDEANELLAEQWPDFADGLVDIRNDPRMADPYDLSVYYEGVHPNGEGRIICAELINAVLLTL